MGTHVLHVHTHCHCCFAGEERKWMRRREQRRVELIEGLCGRSFTCTVFSPGSYGVRNGQQFWGRNWEETGRFMARRYISHLWGDFTSLHLLQSVLHLKQNISTFLKPSFKCVSSRQVTPTTLQCLWPIFIYFFYTLKVFLSSHCCIAQHLVCFNNQALFENVAFRKSHAKFAFSAHLFI